MEDYYKLVDLERHKYFVFKGKMLVEPEILLNATISELKDFHCNYSFLENDEDKSDLYKALRMKIELQESGE